MTVKGNQKTKDRNQCLSGHPKAQEAGLEKGKYKNLCLDGRFIGHGWFLYSEGIGHHMVRWSVSNRGQ